MITETHCHLDYLKSLPLEEILQKSSQAGVDKIITIAVEPDNFDAVFNLANTYSQVYFTQGVHPHDATLLDDQALAKIKERSSHSKMVAVGEIGLDYYYDNSPRDIQREAFCQQLEIACLVNKPVVIHSRDAESDTIEILSKYLDKLQRKGVIHSFTSRPELAQFAIENGFYIGLNGIITFKSAQDIRDIVKTTPLNKILLETDAPFLTPVPHRGKENAPYYLSLIAEQIAQIKSIDLETVLKQCQHNAEELFKFNPQS